MGLDEKETEIYLALLSLKVAGASDVARLAKQSRSHTYLILRALEEKGLASETEERGLLRFVAEPPERLLSYLKAREEECKDLQTLVQGALPALSSLTPGYVGSPRVTTCKGLDGMKQMYRDVLTQEFTGIYNPQASQDTFGDNIVTMLFGTEVRLNGRDLLVRGKAADNYLRDLPPHSGYATRLLPPGVTFDTDTLCFGDTLMLCTFDEERTVVRIDNRKIAHAFRAWFELLWGISQTPGS